MSWVDDKLKRLAAFGHALFAGGAALPSRPNINFGTGLTAVDAPEINAISVSASGGGALILQTASVSVARTLGFGEADADILLTGRRTFLGLQRSTSDAADVTLLDDPGQEGDELEIKNIHATRTLDLVHPPEETVTLQPDDTARWVYDGESWGIVGVVAAGAGSPTPEPIGQAAVVQGDAVVLPLDSTSSFTQASAALDVTIPNGHLALFWLTASVRAHRGNIVNTAGVLSITGGLDHAVMCILRIEKDGVPVSDWLAVATVGGPPLTHAEPALAWMSDAPYWYTDLAGIYAESAAGTSSYRAVIKPAAADFGAGLVGVVEIGLRVAIFAVPPTP